MQSCQHVNHVNSCCKSKGRPYPVYIGSSILFLIKSTVNVLYKYMHIIYITHWISNCCCATNLYCKIVHLCHWLGTDVCNQGDQVCMGIFSLKVWNYIGIYFTDKDKNRILSFLQWNQFLHTLFNELGMAVLCFLVLFSSFVFYND